MFETILSSITNLVTIISIYFAYKSLSKQMTADRENIITQFSLETNHQDAKEILSHSLEILKNLQILEEGFLHRGTRIPSIEDRMQSFSLKNGEASMSIAQRAFQFRLTGSKIIEESIKIISLTPKSDLPKILETCKEIKSFLYGHIEPKKPLNTMINHLMGYLENDIRPQGSSPSPANHEINTLCDDYHQKLHEFQTRLLHQLEEELPYFAKKHKLNSLNKEK